jgi:hypothetical protein
MGFQTTVARLSGFGVPGELYTDSPTRAQSYILQSTTSSLNIIGATAYTVVSEGIAQAGGTGVFAGFLIDPKQYALFATGGQTLVPSLTLPNNTQADLLTMGDIVVTLPGAAAIGDYVIFNNTTGVISTITPATPVPGGSTFANAYVNFYTVSGAGLAVITVDPKLIILAS